MGPENPGISETEHWRKHFENYDLFLMNHEKYLAMLRFHVAAMRDAHRVLDSGAGTGNLTLVLLKEGHEVTAVDQDPTALSIIQSKCVGFDGLHLTRANLEGNLSFQDDSFDGAVSCFVLPYVRDFERYFSEHHRILRNGGVFSASIILPIEGFMNGYILPELKKDLVKKGILPEYGEAWQKVVETSQTNETTILQNGRSREEFFELLKATGFEDIEENPEKPYDENVMLVKGKKME